MPKNGLLFDNIEEKRKYFKYALRTYRKAKPQNSRICKYPARRLIRKGSSKAMFPFTVGVQPEM